MNGLVYAGGEAPPEYKCSACAAQGCKLWRQSNTFADHLRLLCIDCGARDQDVVLEDVREDGTFRFTKDRLDFHRLDQIWGLVPAVPCEDDDTYWGYSSVPEPGVQWWKRLPLRDERALIGSLPDGGPSEWSIDQIRRWTENRYVGHHEYARAALRKLLAEIDARPEIVICAAIRLPDGRVIRGHRHGDCIRTAKELIDHRHSIGFEPTDYEGLRPDMGPESQGFVSSRNRYVTRADGLALQLSAGIESVAEGGYRGTLFSEDLYGSEPPKEPPI
jgi:hypothetical protein